MSKEGPNIGGGGCITAKTNYIDVLKLSVYHFQA